jgi:hypothetical protein
MQQWKNWTSSKGAESCGIGLAARSTESSPTPSRTSATFQATPGAAHRRNPYDVADTVRGIKHVYVEGVQAMVKDDEVVQHRVNAKLTFVVEAERE